MTASAAVGRLVWRVLDPVLRHVQSRLDHLRRHPDSVLSSIPWESVAEIAKGVKIYPEALLQNAGDRGHLRIGDFCHLRGELAVLTAEGLLEIGHHSFVGPGSRIWAQRNIKIGCHVLISHLVDIHDTNAHSLDFGPRRLDGFNLFEHGVPVNWDRVTAAPVTIEDDVWIGFKSSILKGVTIGRGAVVAACTVVTSDVPAFTLVAGNPARVIRALSEKG